MTVIDNSTRARQFLDDRPTMCEGIGPDDLRHARDSALDTCRLCQAGMEGSASALETTRAIEVRRQRGGDRDLGLKVLHAFTGPMADHEDSLWFTLLALEAVEAEPCINCGEAAR